MLGNGTFILAVQTGALAVAAVLSSLYPVTTVILASVFLHERVTRVARRRDRAGRRGHRLHRGGLGRLIRSSDACAQADALDLVRVVGGRRPRAKPSSARMGSGPSRAARSRSRWRRTTASSTVRGVRAAFRARTVAAGRSSTMAIGRHAGRRRPPEQRSTCRRLDVGRVDDGQPARGEPPLELAVESPEGRARRALVGFVARDERADSVGRQDLRRRRNDAPRRWTCRSRPHRRARPGSDPGGR